MAYSGAYPVTSRSKAAKERVMTTQVLVVDDEPSICSALRLILQLEGYAVAAASNGREAIDRVRAETPDVVLLDLSMPVMDGRECWARLHDMAPELPVVIMTAHHRAGAELGHAAAGCLPKPFDVDGVLDTVARFVPDPHG